MRHHSKIAENYETKESKLKCLLSLHCWWCRWCAQGPTRGHFGCVKPIFKKPSGQKTPQSLASHWPKTMVLLLLLLPLQLFSQSRSGRKSSNSWCLRIFWDSRSKKHRKDRCFLCLGSPKPRYLRCFLPLVAKTTVFTVFFGQHLAKTLVFTHFSACCKNYFFHAKGTKTL